MQRHSGKLPFSVGSQNEFCPKRNSDWCVCMPLPFCPKTGFGMNDASNPNFRATCFTTNRKVEMLSASEVHRRNENRSRVGCALLHDVQPQLKA